MHHAFNKILASIKVALKVLQNFVKLIERCIDALIPAGRAKTADGSALPNGGRVFGYLASARSRVHPDLGYWATFFFLNALLFLPLVLVDREDGALLPTLQLAGRSFEQIWRQALVWRRAPDLLRFNSELVLLICLWALIPRLRRTGIRRGFVVAYLFLFAYYLYEGASLTFFSVEPDFYSQFRMATEGLGFFLQNARVTFAFGAAIVALIAVGALVVARLSRLVMPHRGPSLTSRIVLGLLAAFIGMQAYSYRGHLGRSEMVFGSIAAKLSRNIAESQRVYNNVHRFDSAKVRAAYDYGGYRLLQQPTIYIIFTESYGTVLYKRPDWRARYRALTQRLEQAGSLMGIEVLDHVILADTRYCSFKEMGRL